MLNPFYRYACSYTDDECQRETDSGYVQSQSQSHTPARVGFE